MPQRPHLAAVHWTYFITCPQTALVPPSSAALEAADNLQLAALFWLCTLCRITTPCGRTLSHTPVKGSQVKYPPLHPERSQPISCFGSHQSVGKAWKSFYLLRKKEKKRKTFFFSFVAAGDKSYWGEKKECEELLLVCSQQNTQRQQRRRDAHVRCAACTHAHPHIHRTQTQKKMRHLTEELRRIEGDYHPTVNSAVYSISDECINTHTCMHTQINTHLSGIKLHRSAGSWLSQTLNHVWT